MELSIVYIASAFFGGLFMFLAPCTLPLVPAFIASMMPDGTMQNARREVLMRTIAFSLGFSVVFVIFGILSGLLGASLTHYKSILTEVGAVIVILFGLSLIGIFEIKYIQRSFQRLRVPTMKKGRVMRPALLGIIFALGWSPCAGPVLASILFLATQTGAVFQSGLLLGLFSMGLALPFILVGALYGYLLGFFNVYAKYNKVISIISGVFLVAIGGSLLITESLMFSSFGFAIYNALGIPPMCSYY